jgi:hypothetical protein
MRSRQRAESASPSRLECVVSPVLSLCPDRLENLEVPLRQVVGKTRIVEELWCVLKAHFVLARLSWPL